MFFLPEDHQWVTRQNRDKQLSCNHMDHILHIWKAIKFKKTCTVWFVSN